MGGARFSLRSDAGVAPLLAATGSGPVLLVVEGDTYLVQAAPLLAALDDAHREVWLLHDAAVAFHLRLRDERAFDAWLDQPQPGRSGWCSGRTGWSW